MDTVNIMKLENIDEALGEFIDNEFTEYAKKHGVVVDYRDFCFAAADGNKVVGIVAGHSYYNEVYVSDLVVSEEYRGRDIGSLLIKRVEEEYDGQGFDNINLTTYAFQALEFYKKLGFEVEYVRECSDEKLRKYFLIKRFQPSVSQA